MAKLKQNRKFKNLRLIFVEKFNPSVQDFYKFLLFKIKAFRPNFQNSSPKELINSKALILNPRSQLYKSKNIFTGDIEFLFKSIFYESFIEHFVRGIPWSDTSIYDKLKNNKINLGINSLDSFLDNIDSFWASKKNNKLPKVWNEIKISINFLGQIIIEAGHIPFIYSLIHNEDIEAIVIERSKRWQTFKMDLSARQQIYSPLSHPDLSEIKTVTLGKRFDIIKKELGIKKGEVLDLGSDWGYYCHKFEEIGFDCTAIEISSESLSFMRKLHRAQNRRFKIIRANILTESVLEYDIVLAFSIFHHFLRTENNFNLFKKFLNNLRIKQMYFLSYLPEDEKMPYVFTSLKPNEFADFILNNSILNKKQLLNYKSFRDRPLYKLSIE